MPSEPGYRAVRAWLVALTLTLSLNACSPSDQEANSSTPYNSVWAELYPNTVAEISESTGEPETLYAAFIAAAAAKDSNAATARWAQFLSTYDTAGEYEDGMHARLVEWARWEAKRLEHRVSGATEKEAAEVERMRVAAQSH